MPIEKDFKKLKPVFGKSMDSLWLNYLLEEGEGKKEIEDLLPILANQGLDEKYDEERISLFPPSKKDAYGEYPLGTIEYAEREFDPFGLREDEWIQHVSIFGRSSCGKTNLVFNIINNFVEKGKPFMIFDWKRNYRDLLAKDNFKDILVFTIGRDICPFRFNPLIPPPGTHPEIWLKKLVEIIAHAYFLGEGVMYLLYRAIDSVYRTFGMYNDKDVLGRLPIGYGVAKLQGRYFDPFLVKFPLFRVMKGKIRDEDIKDRMQAFYNRTN